MPNLPDIERLKIRPDFLAAAKGASCARGAVVVQALDRGDGLRLIRLGFTATRRIGGAVVRNRAKRRLRHAAAALVPLHGKPGRDYVFIARAGTAKRPWVTTRMGRRRCPLSTGCCTSRPPLMESRT